MKYSNNKIRKLKCPAALQVLSAFNYVFAISGIYALISYVYSYGYGLRFNIPSLSFILSALSISAYLVSANGYSQLKWIRGYIAGNIAAFTHLPFSILLVFFGKPPRPELPSVLYFRIAVGILYPLITIILLNIVYRKLFFENKYINENQNNETQSKDEKWHF
jgi:hypothetical protein